MRKRNLQPALFTLIYVILLSFSPWFFGHQSCSLKSKAFYDLINKINCRLHFSASDRTLEAYSAWFAVVFASAALFWAWKGFSVQFETLRIQGETLRLQMETLRVQQGEMFLNSLSKEYQTRLEDIGLWALMQIYSSSVGSFIVNNDANSTSSQIKLIYCLNMIKARKSFVEITDLIHNCVNLQDYLRISREYNDLIDYHKLEILKVGSTPDRAWVNVMGLIEELDAIHQALATKVSSEPDVFTPSTDRPA